MSSYGLTHFHAENGLCAIGLVLSEWTNISSYFQSHGRAFFKNWFRMHIRCWRNVSRKLLFQICLLFWSLSKPAQDGLLWSMQSSGTLAMDESSDEDDDSDDGQASSASGRRGGWSRKTNWHLNGVHVCRRAFCRMLAVGQSRLQRARHTFQGVDERRFRGLLCWKLRCLAC